MPDGSDSEDTGGETNDNAPTSSSPMGHATPSPSSTDTPAKCLQVVDEHKKPIKQAQRWIIGVGISTLLVNSVIAIIYFGELREMTAATNASEQSAYAACISAQLARRTLTELQAGGTDTHNLAVGTLTQAAAITRAEAAQITVSMVGHNITSLDDNLSAPFEIRNIGQSNALNVEVKAVIDVVDLGHEPTFSYSQSSINYMKTGSVNRGDFAPVTFYKMMAGKQAKLNSAEEVQIGTGLKYVVAYGTVSYQDIFGVSHWAKFCNHLQFPNQHGNPDLHFYNKCAEYNAVDIVQIAAASQTQSQSVSLPKEVSCPAPKQESDGWFNVMTNLFRR